MQLIVLCVSCCGDCPNSYQHDSSWDDEPVWLCRIDKHIIRDPASVKDNCPARLSLYLPKATTNKKRK